jgi:hypothetical protein
MDKNERFHHSNKPCGCKTWEQAGKKKGSFEEHVEYCQDHDPEFGDDKPARTEKRATRSPSAERS